MPTQPQNFRKGKRAVSLTPKCQENGAGSLCNVPAAHPKHEGRFLPAEPGVLCEQHQPRQCGDKVTEIADTAPLLEKALRWPKKKPSANFFPHRILICTAVMSWKKIRAFSCKK